MVYDVPADTTAADHRGRLRRHGDEHGAGQNGYLTFTGTAGQKISVLVSNVNGMTQAELDVLKPNGTSLLSAPITVTSSGAWLQPTAPLPVTGQYKILLDPQLTGVGSADVNLYVVPADLSGTITPGTPLSIATTAPGQNAKYSFTATIGQRMSLNLTGVTIQSVKVTIQKPDGTTLATKTVGTSGGFIDVTASPDRRRLLQGVRRSANLLLRRHHARPLRRPPDAPEHSAGVAKTLTTTVPGQNAKWTFGATSGQRLSFSFTGVTMASVRVTVRTPRERCS